MTTDYPTFPNSTDRIYDTAASMIATRLEQVSTDEPEQANQVFGRRGADGRTPIVVTPRRTSKVNVLALFLGIMMAFTGLFLSQIPFVKQYLADPIIWTGFGLVTYWPIMLLLLVIGIYPLLTLSIPSGVYAMMTRHGRYVGVYQAGRHLLPPWYKVAYMVTRQSTAYNAPIKNCPTADNVMVRIDFLVVFHVEDPEAFVYKLGAEKFGDLLGSAAEEGIRGLVRSITHDRAYELRGQGAGEMIASLNEQFQRFGVVFTSASITNVILPNELAKALESQTVFDAKRREQEKQQEYSLKVLNDREALARQELNKKNERLAADEEARRDRELIARETEEIQAQKQKRMAEIEAEKEAAVIQLRAEGELQAAQKHAEALRIEAEAEGAAAPLLASRRAFELEEQRIAMLARIADNQNVVISGQNGDNILAQLTAAAKSAPVMGLELADGKAKRSRNGAVQSN